MPVPKQITNYLDKRGAKYAIVTHKKVYTAYDAAQTLKKKLDEIVKNLLVKTNKGFVIVLLPASKNVNLQKLKKLMNAKGKGIKKIELPKEQTMVRLFKVKPGALPAFGSLHDLEVYMDKSLKKVKKAIFASGSFTESIEMAMKEFEKLEEPIIGVFSEIKKLKKPVKKAVKKAKKTAKKTQKQVKKGIKKAIKKKK
ncbi:MAG TPA: YbaK/EbsC family protein [Candidatus Uhrbacteria bacterium]|nr:YbaK/EbsC family protein [Candidatus Uhrbacteria bacterium]